jgi:hypothetical protein
MQPTLFLRRVLGFDALTCLAMGAMLSVASQPLAPILGLPAELLFWAGILLLPTAAFMGFLATRQAPPTLLVWVVILGNLGWVIESFVVIGQLGSSITPLGTAFVAAQALAVLTLAGLEYVGLRRSRGTVAA